jgi:hypothetical protein
MNLKRWTDSCRSLSGPSYCQRQHPQVAAESNRVALPTRRRAGDDSAATAVDIKPRGRVSRRLTLGLCA